MGDGKDGRAGLGVVIAFGELPNHRIIHSEQSRFPFQSP